jgi:hypothetical protein
MANFMNHPFAVSAAILGYIDPNAGGMLFQILISVFAGIGAIWAAFGRKIRKLVNVVLKRKEKPDDSDPGEPKAPEEPKK